MIEIVGLDDFRKRWAEFEQAAFAFLRNVNELAAWADRLEMQYAEVRRG